MKRWNYSWIILSALLLNTLFLKTACASDSPESSEITRSFDFAQHLSEAKAVLFEPEQKNYVEGEWTKDHFEFIDMSAEHKIRLEKMSLPDDDRMVIRLALNQNMRKILKFKPVPKGSSLTIYYGAPQNAHSAAIPGYAYIKVWAGNHLLDRIRVASTTEWAQQKFSLPELHYLKGDIAISFDLMGDSIDKSQDFFFNAVLS